ncbi:glycosyltransferase family protein [Natronoflexus pectinivorans]|uniref:Glycosyltransferase involved in cell wall biosynthesis n=1 Tax=Natronoflexus pectinivorans TaxID=682526 RepID=A0A4R2GHH8_9BACT|nr:hypothetical protein [Natronoflexus pectinivorans]TCO07878.1 hypothetical protein EV194_10618 [Natronoflexus pectinivorans]
MRLFFFPPPYPKTRSVNYNPYTDNFRNHLSEKCKVVNTKESSSAVLNLLKHLFRFDVVVFNWIENISKKPYKELQLFLFLICFVVIKIRKVRIVWIMHNIHPHDGENWVSRLIKKMMFKHASLIVAHSGEAQIFAGKLASGKVLFEHHPVNYRPKPLMVGRKKEIDVLIWGAIEPYKGILEFVRYIATNKIQWKVKIVGRCKDPDYDKQLQEAISHCRFVSFENRRIPEEELSQLVESSSFVVFPYLSSSVSSSGALMDTLMLRGNIIGPNKGAFKDLGIQELCFTFNTYDEICERVESNKKINYRKLEHFLRDNDWSLFVRKTLSQISNV